MSLWTPRLSKPESKRRGWTSSLVTRPCSGHHHSSGCASSSAAPRVSSSKHPVFPETKRPFRWKANGHFHVAERSLRERGGAERPTTRILRALNEGSVARAVTIAVSGRAWSSTLIVTPGANLALISAGQFRGHTPQIPNLATATGNCSLRPRPQAHAAGRPMI